ncbi:hypothetical protein [Streptomyces gobiensis]|uniref:hypothetical protein n=1 Tax=Streptomyces gobiensis TaxID=2875706 RepID=UPI001E4C948E|nr:hypothetical protein [Streptomyces gobiensis]UGY91957.1 hypothetical protein test1122_09645 [Streptomyces gobiensis]
MSEEPATPPIQQQAGIDLEDRVTEFTAGFDKRVGYRPPDREERQTVAEGVGLLLDGRPEDSQRRLSDVDFGLRMLTDRVSGREFAEVADTAENGEANRGWGRIYIDLSATARWSVQVPHPVADQDSERLGVGVLRGTPGGVLVLAGAHREAGQGNAADVAHRRDTVFHAICDELLERQLPGVQIHGFANESVPEFDVVLSTGKGTKGRDQARELAGALRGEGLEVCRAWARPCELAGSTNVQGRRAAAEKVPFLHIEFNRDVRASKDRSRQVVDAMAATAATWTAP